LDDYVKLELDASRNGWVCSGCGLFTDCVGRPHFGQEVWFVKCKTISWIENKPEYVYCPRCGKLIGGDSHD
jgi:hypothetical protein